MSSPLQRTAILDACVLYPAPLRDLLLRLAEAELYIPKWTSTIQAEWVKNLLAKRKDLTNDQLKRTIHTMNAAFPDANIQGHEWMIEKLKLPDLRDRHVLAAAIQGDVDIIVTSNLKDFPSYALAPFQINAQHPDNFVANIIRAYPDTAKSAFDRQVSALTKPQKTKKEVLEKLQNCDLIHTVELLK